MVILQRKVYAKVGELIQGKTAAKASFLITNQCSRYFYTTTALLKGGTQQIVLKEKSFNALIAFLLVIEGHAFTTIKQKLKAGTSEYTERINLHLPAVSIKQHSNIPEGKGLSSSSADILSVLLTVNDYLRTGLNREMLYRIAALVDPTDPCIAPPMMIFDQVNGCILEQLPVMDYHIIYFDSSYNKHVDTVMLNKSTAYSSEAYVTYASLLSSFKTAIMKKSYPDFFNLTIQSAMLNQKRLKHANIGLLLAFAQSHRTGLFVAHSGTYMGLIITPLQLQYIYPYATAFIKRYWNTSIYCQ